MTSLKQYIKKNKMSQADLARAIGITEACVSFYLSGKRRIGRQTALKISAITGIPVLHLLYPKENQ